MKQTRTMLIIATTIFASLGIGACEKDTAQSKSETSVTKYLSQKGDKVFSLIKQDRRDAIDGLLEDIEYNNPAEALILKNCAEISGQEIFRHNPYHAMMHTIQSQIMTHLTSGSTQDTFSDFKAACLLDKKWDNIWPQAALETILVRLSSLQKAGYSLTLLSDDIFISPDPRYLTKKQGSDVRRFDSVVLRKPILSHDSSAPNDHLQDSIGFQQFHISMIQKNISSKNHYLIPGTWFELTNKICQENKTIWNAWRQNFENIADGYAKNGMYSSALIVQMLIFKNDGTDDVNIAKKGIAVLTDYQKTLIDCPHYAHNYMVALGYWYDYSHEVLIPSECKEVFCNLINRSASSAGLIDRLILAFHMNLPLDNINQICKMFKAPWKENKQALEFHEQAKNEFYNMEKKKQLLERSYELGNIEALCALGYLYQTDILKDNNYQQTFKCYDIAAKADIPMAYNQLAILYENGYGCTKDPVKAYNYYCHAADYGNDDALFNIANYYSSDVYYDNIPLALAIYSVAKDFGHALSWYQLGWHYYSGTGVEVSKQKATAHWIKAAELGSREAMHNLSICYYKGDGVGRDIQKAIEYTSMAAQFKHPEAMYNVYCLYTQELVEITEQQALSWLLAAAEAGSANATQKIKEIRAIQDSHLAQQHRSQSSNQYKSYVGSTDYYSQDDSDDYQKRLNEAQENHRREMRNYEMQLRQNLSALGVGF